MNYHVSSRRCLPATVVKFAITISSVFTTANLATAAEFIPLGALPGHNLSWPYGVSDDGTVVTGMSVLGSGDGYPAGSPSGAFRWTEAAGMVSLDLILPDAPLFRGQRFGTQNLSSDGTTIVGGASGPNAGNRQAFINTQSGGTTGLGGTASHAHDVSHDGGVVVGRFDNPNAEAFRWTADGGLQGLGVLPGHLSSNATDVSDDGTTVVGFSREDEFASLADHGDIFRWTETGGMESIGVRVDRIRGGAKVHVSNAGTTVASATYLTSPTNGEAFYWTEDTGVVPLGWLPITGSMEGVHSVTRDMTPDGRLIVGWSGEPIGDRDVKPFVWTETAGMENFQQVLIGDHGLGDVLDGWQLKSISAVSSNGQYFVGYSGADENPTGNRTAWLVRLDAPWGTVIPEPASSVLLGIGLTAVCFRRGWRRKAEPK